MLKEWWKSEKTLFLSPHLKLKFEFSVNNDTVQKVKPHVEDLQAMTD